MAGRYKAYPEYKDSGVEWFDRVPKQWGLLRHKYVSNFYKGKNPSTLLDSQKENTFRYLSMDYLRGGAEAKYAQIEAGSYVTDEGQILIIWDGSNAGEFVRGSSGILSSTMAAAELIYGILPQFYWYVCACLEPDMRKHANGMGIPHVNGNELRNSFLPIPLSCEQKQIARFLDHETEKIDALIEKQQALIALLQEKRQAVISHAVTKGLSPEARMRDSGVEWLGDVPEHWEVKQLRRLTHLQQGLQIPQSERFSEAGENRVEYITIKGINEGDSRSHREYILAPSARVVCSHSDVLLARTGATGEVVTGVTGAFHNNFFKVNYDVKQVSKGFLVYLLKAKEIKAHLLMLAGTTTIPDLNHGAFLGTRVALPCEDEQQQICKYLDDTLKEYDCSEGAAIAMINLLQERRTALISAAVTGKIDVRDWEPTSEAQK